MLLNDGPKFKFSKSLRFPKTINNSPGPGSYNPPDTKKYK